MRLLGRFKSFFRNLRRRSAAESELGEELRSYVDELTERKIGEGMDQAAARRSALVEIGGLEQLKESTRAEKVGFHFEANVLKTLQVAVRRLWHEPGFTIVAVMTLALAIGANTAIFSIADYVLFRPLPYKDPDRVHVLRMLSHRDGIQYTLTPFQHLELINEHHRGLSEVGMLSSSDSVLVTANGTTEAVQAVQVTPNYFEVLGVQAYRGRLFRPEDVGRSGAIVMTHAGWVQRFDGDEGVIGKTVPLGSVNVELLGVLPPGFVFPSGFSRRTQIIRVEPPPRAGQAGGTFHPIVRREPGVSREQAEAEIQALVAGLGSTDSQNGRAHPVLNDVKEVLFPVGRRVMAFLLAASGLVLLIGCANLGIMLLVRSQRRVRETGVRAALGASRLQLVLPVFFEALIIGVVGALLAVATTSLLFDLMLLQVRPETYGTLPVGVDLRVALYGLGLGMVGGLIFAVAPAWRSAKLDVQALIQGRQDQIVRRGRLGRPLVLLQSALAMVVVVGAVRVGASFNVLLNEPLGFEPDNVIVAQFFPRAEGGVTYADVVQTLARRPDVASVGASYLAPLDDSGAYDSLANDPQVRGGGLSLVLPGFFEAAGIPLKRGRLLTWDDLRAGGEAAILSESAARAMFGSGDPLGAIFASRTGQKFRVVGVVGDTKRPSSKWPVVHVMPWQQNRPMKVVVRTRSAGDAMLADIKREIAGMVSGVPVAANWLTDDMAALPRYRDPRFQTLVMGTFAMLALTLTALGIFGVSAFAVALRTKEMGIRMALGARGGSLVRMMVWQVLGPVGLGLVATRWVGKVAETQAGLTAGPSSGWVLGVAAGTVIVASLIAAYVPARRASRVDPVIVLRSE